MKGGDRMSELTERVSYLEGLLQGLDISDRDAQSRMMNGIVSVLGDVAREITVLSEGQEQIETYLGDMDEDLMEIEDTIFGEDDADAVCGMCGIPVEQIPDDESLELICPDCGETVWDPTDDLDMSQNESVPHSMMPAPGEDRPG